MIRVFLAYEHRVLCDALAAVLQTDPEIHIVGCADTIRAALAHPAFVTCHIVLASIKLPNNAALQLVRTVMDTKIPIKVMITDLIQSTAAVMQCVEEGAAGYVYEDESVADLRMKIHALDESKFLVSPTVAAALMMRIVELKRLTQDSEQPKMGGQWDELTPRERQVLELLAQSCSNQEIADALTIEVGTVKNHVHSIFRKLDIRERHHAALFAQINRQLS